MRVLWITANFYPQAGGLQVYTDKVVNGLAEHCETGLLTEAGQFAHENRAVAHFEVERITRPKSLADWERAADEIAQIVETFQPDVVHFANACAAVYRAAIPDGIAVVTTVHGNDLTAPWQGTPERDTKESIVWSLNGCNQIVAVSQHTAELVRQWFVTAPLTVLTSGVDLDFFHPDASLVQDTRSRYGIEDSEYVLLSVARLVPRKGHLNILEALRCVRSPFVWFVVGGGMLQESLQNAIGVSGIGHQIHMLGHVPDQELLALLNACDAFVLTPDERRDGDRVNSEGFGLVYHEAAACGKPAIASNTSGCKEAVLHGITGLIVPPSDPVALTESIEYLIANRDAGSTMGQGGLALVRTLGGWPRLARQNFEIYRELVSGSRSKD